MPLSPVSPPGPTNLDELVPVFAPPPGVLVSIQRNPNVLPIAPTKLVEGGILLPDTEAVPGIFSTLDIVPPLAVITTLPGVNINLQFKFMAILNKPFLSEFDELEKYSGVGSSRS